MKAIRIGLLLAMVVAVAAFVVAEDKPWFDLENCSMCKGMMAQEGLMENMTWDHYLTKNGMMSVTTIADGYREKYDASHDRAGSACDDLGRRRRIRPIASD